MISSGIGRDFYSDVVHPAFLLPITASPILRSALKDGFDEAVLTHDIPEPCEFPSLNSCPKKFLWTHKLILLGTNSLVLFAKNEMWRSFLRYLVSKT